MAKETRRHGTFFNDSERPYNHDFKVTLVFDVQYLAHKVTATVTIEQEVICGEVRHVIFYDLE